eukprot:446222-Prorocentrum_lima.AAC.1
MTSSLVGSEMCIRDRPLSAARGRQSGWNDWCHGGRLKNGAGVGGRRRVGCLLYTSDAADDM